MTDPEAKAPPVEPAAAAPSLARGVLVALLLTICVFAVLSVLGDVRALGDSLASFRLGALAAAIGLVLGNYLLRYLRWQYYLRTIGVRVEAALSAPVFVAGFVMSVTPGKMGEVLKSFLLFEYRRIDIARTASVVVAERLLDLVALVLLVSVAGAGFPHGRMIAGAGALLVSGIVLACTIKSFGLFILDKLEQVPPLRRIAPKLRDAYGALYDLTRVRPFLVGAAYATAGWTLECLATWCLIEGFPGVEMSPQGAGFAYAAGTLAGALAMLPGGLGVAEFGMTRLFQLASPELTLATATAATILVRLCTLWFGVALGGLALSGLRLRQRAIANKHSG